MISQPLKKSIDQIEECVDEAKRALQATQAPDAVRDCVESLHEQARRVRQDGSSFDEDSQMQGAVMELEKEADRALEACRNASNLQPQMLAALQRAHDEVSRLKKQLAGSPA